MSEPSQVVLRFWSLLVGIAALLLATRLGDSASKAAQAPQVPALEQRLEELARRTRLKAEGEGRPLLLILRPGLRCGRYHGLALETGWNHQGEVTGGETHLAFTVEAHRQLGLRNPARPPLPAVVLSRLPLRSDLGTGRRLRVELATGKPEDPAASRIAIDNRDGEPWAATAQATNRAFADLVGYAHCDLDGPTAQQLGLLESLLRARICTNSGPATCRDTVLTLRPSPVEGRLFATVRAQGEPSAAAFELLVGIAPDGTPSRLHLRRAAAAASSTELAWLSVHRPVGAGEDLAPAAGEIASGVPADGEPRPDLSLDLAPLLEGTGWSRVTLPWR